MRTRSDHGFILYTVETFRRLLNMHSQTFSLDYPEAPEGFTSIIFRCYVQSSVLRANNNDRINRPYFLNIFRSLDTDGNIIVEEIAPVASVGRAYNFSDNTHYCTIYVKNNILARDFFRKLNTVFFLNYYRDTSGLLSTLCLDSDIVMMLCANDILDLPISEFVNRFNAIQARRAVAHEAAISAAQIELHNSDDDINLSSFVQGSIDRVLIELNRGQGQLAVLERLFMIFRNNESSIVADSVLDSHSGIELTIPSADSKMQSCTKPTLSKYLEDPVNTFHATHLLTAAANLLPIEQRRAIMLHGAKDLEIPEQTCAITLETITHDCAALVGLLAINEQYFFRIFNVADPAQYAQTVNYIIKNGTPIDPISRNIPFLALQKFASLAEFQTFVRSIPASEIISNLNNLCRIQ